MGASAVTGHTGQREPATQSRDGQAKALTAR
jgi:hypothetical protein